MKQRDLRKTIRRIIASSNIIEVGDIFRLFRYLRVREEKISTKNRRSIKHER